MSVQNLSLRTEPAASKTPIVATSQPTDTVSSVAQTQLATTRQEEEKQDLQDIRQRLSFKITLYVTYGGYMAPGRYIHYIQPGQWIVISSILSNKRELGLFKVISDASDRDYRLTLETMVD